MRTSLATLIFACLLTIVYSSPGITAQTPPDSQAALSPAPADCDEPEQAASEEIDALGIEDPDVSVGEEDAQQPDASVDPTDFDIPVVLNEAVNKYLRFFSVTKHELFVKWLKRTRTYAPVVKEILKQHGLPEDLVYLAMVESGFNMKAFSRAKACGPWQFIHETGERYGLTVNYWVDERRDLEKSTVAAARYLKALFDQFGCWQLAAAGYNAGEHRVERAVEKHDTNDFWKLRAYNALPKETREYVPQIFAAAIIAKDPERFGFADLDCPAYDPERIKVPGGISLREIANAGSLQLTELKALNPEMLKGVTPPNSKGYIVKLPESADPEDVSKKLETNLAHSRQIVGVIKHSVKKKDSLPRILKRYRIDSSDLALLNDDGDDLRLRKGQVLYIPRFASLRSKAVSVEPLDESDEITELPNRKKTTERESMVWSEDENDDVISVKVRKVAGTKGVSSIDSNKAKVRVARQGGIGARKGNVRVVKKVRDDTDGKARLTRLTVKKSNRLHSATVSSEKRHSIAHRRYLRHKK
jgi:membrane-bound lytic murein transglycosylase D